MRTQTSDPAYPQMLATSKAAENLRERLAPSQGQPTMSNEDVKLALIETMIALDWQAQLNDKLIERIQQLESKKSHPFRR